MIEKILMEHKDQNLGTNTIQNYKEICLTPRLTDFPVIRLAARYTAL